MVEKLGREKIGFDPKKMGALETSLYRNLLLGDALGAFESQLEMYEEQWNLLPHVASGAIHFIEASHVFIGGESNKTATLLIYAYYSLIARDSGLKFDPVAVTEAYIDAAKKVSDKKPFPISEASKLFGLIYSIDPNDETLQEAMDLRGSAFHMLQNKKDFGKTEEDWKEFQGYITDYYKYLQMAIDR